MTENNIFSGKIAVATNDQIRVTGHIGRCKAFIICQIDDGKIIKKEVMENIFTAHVGNQHLQGSNDNQHDNHQHNHSNLIDALKDCKYLISKGGGWRVVEDLKQNGIATIFSDVEFIDEAIALFIKDELKNDSDLFCRHN